MSFRDFNNIINGIMHLILHGKFNIMPEILVLTHGNDFNNMLYNLLLHKHVDMLELEDKGSNNNNKYIVSYPLVLLVNHGIEMQEREYLNNFIIGFFLLHF